VTDRQTNKQMDGQTDKQMDKWIGLTMIERSWDLIH